MQEPRGLGRFVPHAWLAAMIAIWGGSYAAVKVALASMPPFPVISLRFWIAIACLLPFLRAGLLADLRRTAGPGFAAGVVLSLGYLLQTVGMQETSASMGGFLAGLIVLLVAVGGFVFFHAPLGTRSLLGLGLGVAGMVLLCWPSGEPGGPQDTLRGILLQVASSTSYAAHILLLSRYGKGAPVVPFCLWQLVVVALAATVAALLPGGGMDRVAAVSWTPALVGALVYLGALATTLGIGVQSNVQHRIPPTHVALLFALQPLFAALVGWLVMGDRLGPLQLTGGFVIVAGVVVCSRER